MKKILIIFLIVVLLSVLARWNNSRPRVIISLLADKGDIHTGELRYKIDLLGILPIGEAVIAVADLEEYKGMKVYHLRATAQSLKAIASFFSSYAVLDSYVDIKQLNPVLFKQKLFVSGKGAEDKEVTYDQMNGIMSMAGVKRQILANTQDPLSAVFNIRHMDFDKIKKLEMNINSNQKNYILEGDVRPQEITINNKLYKIIVLKADIRRRDKNPYHRSTIDMVLLKDKENIPVLIKVFAGGVFINAKLIEIK